MILLIYDLIKISQSESWLRMGNIECLKLKNIHYKHFKIRKNNLEN